MACEVFNAPDAPRPRMQAPRPASTCIQYWDLADHGPTAPRGAARAAAGRAMSQMVVALRSLAPLHGAAAVRNGCHALVWN